MTIWAVQTNIGSQKDIDSLKSAIPEEKFVPITAIPFSDELPNVPTDKPTVFYGATSFTTNIHKSNKWNPGVFFDEEKFSFKSYMEHYGKELLNHDAFVVPLSEIPYMELPKAVFVRPNNDLKGFAGTLSNGQEFKQWAKTILAGDFDLKDSEVVLATPKEIAHEWRLFLIENRVIAGSHYRSYGKLIIDKDIPDKVLQYAISIDWWPANVYTLDIAEYNDELRIIEANCFNSSGFYAANVKRLVDNITDYVGE